MAIRPVFLPAFDGPLLVREQLVALEWNSGFAVTQKQKNVDALHSAASAVGLGPLLEASTKSVNPLGRALSAFELNIAISPDREAPIEVVYQSSKVFERGGPYLELIALEPREARRDGRLRSSGEIIRFEFAGRVFSNHPETAFYDWLFVRSLWRRPELRSRLAEFAGFTDIEFNPNRSINCQARSIATVVSLESRGLLERAAKRFDYFRWLLRLTPARRGQGRLAVERSQDPHKVTPMNPD